MAVKIEIEPVVVVPDVAPLIHLAAGGVLHLLSSYGRVVIMDAVAFEATRYPDKPYAKEIAEWLKHGQMKNSNHPVEIQKTEAGYTYKMTVKSDPKYRAKHAGERAIRDWLADTLPELGGAVLVIYEDARVPDLLERQKLDGFVMTATTKTFLHFSERQGLVTSAEELWKKITSSATTASDKTKMRIHTPLKL